MRRNWKLWTCAGALALAVLIIGWQVSITGAQNGNNGEGKRAPDNPLPIRQVVLFNSGVGYFQREGEVSGDARVELTFPASDINDLLKSLVLQDLGGGRVSTVSYDSHDPIDKILRSFALDLNANPTFGQILNQARGEKIEVTKMPGKDAPGEKIFGTIIGMEVKQKPVTKDGPAVEHDMLNLSTAKGLQMIPLDQVLHVKFLNPTLENEFQRALDVLARSHDRQKKTVNLAFNGPGKRAVRVGYIVERPIWKTTYRLRMEPNGKIFLQGWAIVENTSDDDWNDVRMVLVSGKPISYQMNLYEPLWIPRPLVEPEMFASLRPPVYSGSLDPNAPAAPVMQGAGGPQMPGNLAQNVQGQGGFQGGQFGQLGFINPFNAQGGNFNNRYQQDLFLNNANNDMLQKQNNKLTYEQLQQRRQEGEKALKEAKKAGQVIAGLNFKEGIQSVATAEEIGDYYQYIIDQKISLPRQKSAMLPILDQVIDGSKISIFNESIHGKYPLLGLRLKNTSGQPLTQGPITVYENSTYAGDTRILNLQPNEERLLSYALDQSTEVKTAVKASPSPEMTFKIGAAELTTRYKVRQTKTYTVKNRSAHNRVVILEHPIRAEWKLIAPEKPSEKSRDVYRFAVAVDSGKSVTFDVTEEQARVDPFAITASPKPHYAIGLGIEIKPVVNVEEPKLVGVRIHKGLLEATWKSRESKTYFVQNESDEDRTFKIEHIVRPDWTVVSDGQKKAGPAVYAMDLAVAKGKTGQKEVIEERVYTDKGKLVKDIPEAKLREFIAHPAPSKAVKAALQEMVAIVAQIADTSKKLAQAEKQLEDLGRDQARLRENLKIIPPSSEHYKKFLEKFVTQEAQIESLQAQVRDLTATLETQRRQQEALITKLDVE